MTDLIEAAPAETVTQQVTVTGPAHPVAAPARTVTASGATLLVTCVLLGMAFAVTLKVLAMPDVDQALVAAIVTAWIVGPVGAAGGFWLGSSVGGRVN